MYFGLTHWKGDLFDMFFCSDISFHTWNKEIISEPFIEIPYWEIGQLLGGN